MTTIEKVGARLYAVDAPFAGKDRLKAIGCHWDGDRRQWWVGAAKAAELAAVVAELNAAPAGPPPAEDVSKCRVYAQVEHKGRRYYVIAESKDCTRCRLTTLDGLTPFWAEMPACNLIRTYEGREVWDGRRYSGKTVTEYQTIGKLKAFRDRQANPDTARGQCTECGHWGPNGEPCESCGGEGCHA